MEEKLVQIFARVFEVEAERVGEISYQSVDAWDSIGHMMMITEIESEFGISIDMDDVIVISNFSECLEKVNKYI